MRFQAAVVLSTLLQAGAWALPEGGRVQHGEVTVQTGGSLVQILQSSPQGIINWSLFHIGPGEVVRILQPNQGVLLNRVVGDQASLIQGLLQANGTVFLLNPNGILITPSATIQTGSFLASTLNMTDQDFLRGNYRLSQLPDRTLAALVNQGTIQVEDGGYVVLTAPLVSNEGVIVARQGTVAVGASQEAVVAFDPTGVLQFRLPDGWRGQASPSEAGAVLLTRGQVSEALGGVLGLAARDEAVQLPAGEGVLVNLGSLVADGGGAIHLDSSRVTWQGGRLRADGAGRIEILSAGTARAAGTVQADGGFVEVSAQRPQLYTAPQVGNGGVVLLDPTDLRIVDTAGDLDGNLPEILADEGPKEGMVSLAALEAVSSGQLVLQASGNIDWEMTQDTSLDLQPGVGLSLQAGGELSADPGLSIRSQGADLALLATGRIRSPALLAQDGNIRVESTEGRIELAGDIRATGLVDLKTPERLDAGSYVIAGGTGVNLQASDLVGEGPNSAARVDSLGPLNLTLTGSDPSAVQGNLASGFNLNTGPETGPIIINGVTVFQGSPDDDGSEQEPGGEDHGGNHLSPGGDDAVAANPEQVEEATRSLGSQLASLGAFATYHVLVTEGEQPRLGVGNAGLSAAGSVPLYTLQLVSILGQDQDDRFWRNLVDQFIIWEDEPDEDRP